MPELWFSLYYSPGGSTIPVCGVLAAVCRPCLCFRPVRAEHISPGQRPGFQASSVISRPVRARQLRCFALPLQGGYTFWASQTQGGGEYALPWAKMRCPYRAKMLAPHR